MTHDELTAMGMPASPHPMKKGLRGMIGRGALAAGAVAILGGCININAPQEAIVIELNVNIQAEVVYRLAEDAGNAIEENADIF